MSTIYTSLYDITTLQTSIMHFVAAWARVERTPIPFKEIVSAMEAKGFHEAAVIQSIKTLVARGYIRKAIVTGSNDNKNRAFVQLRSVL